jgi:citrate synthase
MTTSPLWISAADAAARLGVSRATLYAYVSRGYIRSQATAAASRERGYSHEDVERLRRRTEERRDPDKATARALQWGMPVLESAITLIDGNRLYYRGHEATDLARRRPLKEVASLIWSGRFDTPFAALEPTDWHGDDALPFAARAQMLLASAAVDDPIAFDVRPHSVALCGWRILHLLTTAATRERCDPTTRIEQVLARAWRVQPNAVDLLRCALILCADHELNVSSFTARCVASAGSNPYAVVIAALSALEGPKHGGAGARVEAMFESLRGAHDIRTAVAARLRRGERLDGLGHPLYPTGDPRASMLLDLLRERYSRSRKLAFVLELRQVADSAIRERPNLDFSLAALARVLRLPSESPLMLFAIGRTIGWIGQAIEQYSTGQLIRPRAKYVGVPPHASEG